MALVSAFLEILQRPTMGDVVIELIVFMVPVWIAVLVGVLVGWAWKPKWANLKLDFPDSPTVKEESIKSGMVPQFYTSISSISSLKLQIPSTISWISHLGVEKESSSLPTVPTPDCRFDAVLSFSLLRILESLFSYE